MSERVSALLIPVLEAEGLVSPHRIKYDPVAALGVPAHVTLLVPFVLAADIDDALLEELRDFFAGFDAFDCAFPRTDRFEDGGVLWLTPEPIERFTRLARALWCRYPEYPPYAGQVADVVMHLTVGQDLDPAAMAEIDSVVGTGLPVEGRAREAWLMQEETDRSWTTRAAFPLGGGA